MRIAVIGAGGVGGYFGARLATSGNSVTFVARGPHFEAMRTTGLTVKSSRGDLELKDVHVVGTIPEVEHVDLVLVAVKLWDTEEVATALQPLVHSPLSVLSLQNGVEKSEVFQQYLPAASLLGGMCYISANISSPGVIQHHGSLQDIVFGEYSGQQSGRALAIFEVMQRAGIDVELSDSIERRIWEKFVFIVGFSAVTAAMRQPIGVIRENPKTRRFLLDIMHEVVQVGRARGVPLSPGYAEDRLAYCDTLPASLTASLRHDLDEGKRLELPWLSGAVARMGDALGIPVPLNRAVADILEPFVPGRLA